MRGERRGAGVRQWVEQTCPDAERTLCMNTQSTHFTASNAVKDSRWEPDGVTLQVRFCEGGATNQYYRDSRRYSPFLQGL